MGGYVKNTNRLFPGLTGELRIEKASGSTAMVASKNKVPNNILPFFLMFHIAERLLNFYILE